jgi:hypothetical protein
MRASRFKAQLVSLLAVALLIATSQYLAHFHVPRGDATASAAHSVDSPHHASNEHCALCLQFDRLPAPPALGLDPIALYVLVATVEAERLQRLALDTPHLWPPSRGPPLA